MEKNGKRKVWFLFKLSFVEFPYGFELNSTLVFNSRTWHLKLFQPLLFFFLTVLNAFEIWDLEA
ncbi:hypothetical protein SCA6_004100 [Theobroma cacao]